MKKLILLIALFSLTQLAYGQRKIRTVDDINKYFDNVVNTNNNTLNEKSLIEPKDDSSQGTLFSEPTLNKIFAKRFAYYLSGENDVSTFKNYFTASSKDKTINVGYNFINPGSRYSDTTRLRTIVSVGVKGSLGTFVQEKTVPSDIGINGSYTYLFGGSVFFDPAIKADLNIKRSYIKSVIYRQMNQEIAIFDSLNKGLNTTPTAAKTITEKRDKLINSLYEKYRDSFAEQEEDGVMYDYSTSKWITTNLYIPLNTTKYNMANSNGSKIDTLNFFPINIGATVGWFKKWQENKSFLLPSFLLTMTVSVIKTNPLTILDTYGNISNRDTVATKLGLKPVKINETKAYQGNGSPYFSFNLKPRILLSWSQSVASLDLFGDLSFGKFAHHDAGFGVLFSLPDKDGKKPINIEPTFTIRDIGNNLIQDKSWLDKLLVGVSISLPFNSLVF